MKKNQLKAVLSHFGALSDHSASIRQLAVSYSAYTFYFIKEPCFAQTKKRDNYAQSTMMFLNFE